MVTKCVHSQHNHTVGLWWHGWLWVCYLVTCPRSACIFTVPDLMTECVCAVWSINISVGVWFEFCLINTHTHSELILIIKNILYLQICSPVKIYYNLKISTSNSVVICGHVWNGKKFGSSNAHIPSWGPCSSAFCSVLVLNKCPFCILLHDKCLAYVCFVLCAGDFTLSDGP